MKPPQTTFRWYSKLIWLNFEMNYYRVITTLSPRGEDKREYTVTFKIKTVLYCHQPWWKPVGSCPQCCCQRSNLWNTLPSDHISLDPQTHSFCRSVPSAVRRKPKSHESDGMTPTEPWSQHHQICLRIKKRQNAPSTEHQWVVGVWKNLPTESLQKLFQFSQRSWCFVEVKSHTHTHTH